MGMTRFELLLAEEKQAMGELEEVKLCKKLLKGPIPLKAMELTNLKVLDCSNNRISSFTVLCELPNLKMLNLKRNIIDSIPEQIGLMKTLHHLLLSDNEISNIPDSLYDLSQLRVLNLASNNISFVSPAISKLQSLRGLSLRGNPIYVLPAKGLSGVKNVSTIDFRSTKLPLDLQVHIEKDKFLCNVYGIDVDKRFGESRGCNASVYTLLAIRKYPMKGCDYFDKLPLNVIQSICEMVFDSADDKVLWECANKQLTTSMIKKESVPTKSDIKEEVAYDKQDYQLKLKEAKEFFEIKEYALAKKYYTMAMDIKPSDDIRKKMEEIEKLRKLEAECLHTQ